MKTSSVCVYIMNSGLLSHVLTQFPRVFFPLMILSHNKPALLHSDGKSVQLVKWTV